MTTSVSALRRLLGRVRALPAAERRATALAVGLLGLARLRLALVPSSRLLGPWGPPAPLDASGAGDDRSTAAELVTARAVGRAVTRAARSTPWRSECLAQAMAARSLLRGEGIAHIVVLGMRRDGDLTAHAWVRVGSEIVVGGPDERAFTPVSTYPWALPTVADNPGPTRAPL